ncbi:MAG: hypothetical protein ACI8XX_002618 [Polaribacter sp.]|jgi:hypothetical protein
MNVGKAREKDAVSISPRESYFPCVNVTLYARPKFTASRSLPGLESQLHTGVFLSVGAFKHQALSKLLANHLL